MIYLCSVNFNQKKIQGNSTTTLHEMISEIFENKKKHMLHRIDMSWSRFSNLFILNKVLRMTICAK